MVQHASLGPVGSATAAPATDSVAGAGSRGRPSQGRRAIPDTQTFRPTRRRKSPTRLPFGSVTPFNACRGWDRASLPTHEHSVSGVQNGSRMDPDTQTFRPTGRRTIPTNTFRARCPLLPAPQGVGHENGTHTVSSYADGGDVSHPRGQASPWRAFASFAGERRVVAQRRARSSTRTEGKKRVKSGSVRGRRSQSAASARRLCRASVAGSYRNRRGFQVKRADGTFRPSPAFPTHKHSVLHSRRHVAPMAAASPAIGCGFSPLPTRSCRSITPSVSPVRRASRPSWRPAPPA